jgi:hypothetical protein
MKEMLSRKIFKVVFVLVLFITPGIMKAQGGGNSSSSQVSTAPPGKRASHRAAKKQWKEDRKKKHNKDKSLRSYQKRTQTKETRRRMRDSRHKAELNNEHKREFFMKRWFKHRKVHKTGKKNR